MISFIKKVIVFLITAITLYLLSLVVLGLIMPSKVLPNVKHKPGSYGCMLTRLQEADKLSKADVLVLGASHAYRGIDPRVFSADSIQLFNLGSSAQTPVQTEYLVNKYLDKLKPKVIVYEVGPTVFSNKGIESTVDIIANSKLNWDMFLMTLKSKDLSAINTFFYAIGKQLVQDVNSIEDNKYDKEDKYVSGGFVEKVSYINNSKLVFDKKKIVFLEEQKKAFERIVAMLSKRGIKLILIQAPITQENYNSIENKLEIDNYFSSFPTVKYYNFNGKLKLDSKEYFYDHHHLNQKGVVVFNAGLLKTIKSDIN